jgi:hypothetical protein
MAMKRGSVTAAAAALCFSGGCTAMTPADAATVRAWMVCFECVHERQAITALGHLKPQALIDALGPKVLANPPMPLGMVQGYQAAFLRDADYRAAHGIPPSPGGMNAYVQERIRRFVEGQRARAGEGLGYMHTPASTAVLNQALAQPLSPGLKRLLIYARDSLP